MPTLAASVHSPSPTPAAVRRANAPVASTATRSRLLRAGPPAVRLNAAMASSINKAALPLHVNQLVSSPGAGTPLPPRIQQTLENSLEVSLNPVRIHTDARSAATVASVGARAFTYGTHIFLGLQESPNDLALMAHEVTHVVQQQGLPVLQMSAGQSANNVFEHEAHQTASAVQRGEPVTVQGRTGGAVVQKESLFQRGVNLVGRGISAVVNLTESGFQGLLNEYAPELAEIIRQGPLDWLKEKITGAINTLMDSLMAPVRAITGVAASLSSHFGNLIAWVREAVARIRKGDCGALKEAAERIQQVFEGIAAPAIERLRHLVDRAKGFFNGLVERFGVPVWQFVQRVGGIVWDRIQQMGRWIWEKTAPIRRIANQAWTWVKNRLGIGDGPEGQDGILQWFQRQAQRVWDQYIHPFIERYKRPLLIVAGVLVMLSPAGPIIAIGAAIGGVAAGIRWLRQNLGTRDGVVNQRNVFERTIIPGILSGVNRVSNFLLEKARWIAGKLTEVVGGLNQAVGAVAGTILNFAVNVLQWIVSNFQELVNWATDKLLGLAEFARSALEGLSVWLRPVMDFLRRVAAVVAAPMRLAYEFGASIWNAIPACLRDPFIDFFIPLILRQIAFFRELGATPEAWQETRAQIMLLVRQVFRDFDLMGAIRTAFRIVVRALRIPVDLMQQLLDKAAQAWDAVIAAPLRFIENSIKAILRGIGRFIRNFPSHLWFGVQGWLLNAFSQSGVTPPAEWTFSAIFGFVLDVMGISIDHIIDLIDRRVPGAGRPLRTAVRVLTGALQWLRVAIEEGPRGLWRHLVDSLGNLGTMVLESAVGWVMTRIMTNVGTRLAALAASAGLSGVLEAVKAVYNAIQTAIEYMPRILAILIRAFDTVVQIAAGTIDPAAQMVEGGLRMAMPVVIGFLANYAGLGGIGGRIREIILDIRARVDNAILGLIDRAIAAIRSVLNAIRSGIRLIFSISRPVTMKGHSHSLTGTVRNNKIEFVFASRPERIRQAIQTGIDQLRRMVTKPPNSENLIRELTELRFSLDDKELSSDFITSGAVDPRGGSRRLPPQEWTEAKVNIASRRLFEIAAQYNLTDLASFFMDVPEQRYLPPGYDVRAQLYIRGSGWSSARQQTLQRDRTDLIQRVTYAINNQDATAWQTLITQNKIERGVPMAGFRLQWLLDGTYRYDIDHRVSLAEHWQYHNGNDVGDNERRSHATNPSNLNLILRRANRSKGAALESAPEERAQFSRKFWVGLSFTSEHAENNASRAKTIDGQPFRRSKDGPPIL